MNVRWSDRAASQLLDAVEYLEGERLGSGWELHDAVRRTVDTVREYPRFFPAIPDTPGGEARRALLRRWNYWLVFEIREDEATLVILALWHAHRRPGGWRET